MMIQLNRRVNWICLLLWSMADILTTDAAKVYTSKQIVMGPKSNQLVLFDFCQIKSVTDWEEKSDTVRRVGMSKAVLTLQQTQLFQRAVLFTLLNPQPNHAGFAGMRIRTKFNLSNYDVIRLIARGQGDSYGYKLVLRHRDQNEEPYPTYEQFFTAPKNFAQINLPLTDFKPFYRGKELNESEVGCLDTSYISSFGIQIYGGVYLPTAQKGVSSLEIDNIIAE